MSARIALAALLLSGCCFGRSYGPAEYNTVFVAPPNLVPRADSSLPEDVCKDLCKDFIASDETLLGCFIASLQSAPIPPKRSLRWEYRHDGAWLNNSMVLTDDDMKGLDPDHVDPALCLAHHSKWEGHVEIRDCRLSPAPPEAPPIGTPLLQCRKRRPGGCDFNLSKNGPTCRTLL